MTPDARSDIGRLGRRGLLAGGVAACLLPAAARAAIVNMCVIGTDGWLFPAFDEVRRSDLALVRRTAQFVNEAVGVLRMAKIETVVSFTPAKSRVYREFLPSDFKWSPDAEKRYGVALEELRRSNTLVPDQATMFAEARKQAPAELLFFKADTHWTAPGAAKSATLLAGAIKEKMHLPPASGPGIKLAAATSVLQERNDLAALLPTPDQSKYPFQSYMVRKPAETNGGGLLAADAADVIVMGNSFMQPAYGFANLVSEQLDRPVSLLWKVHQFSPYYNMLTYLGSDAFKKQRPKLIVWNFAEVDMETPSNNPGAWGDTVMPPATFMTNLHKALGV